MPSDLELPHFHAPFAVDDRAVAIRLLANAGLSREQDARIDRTATRLIEAIRAKDDRLGGVEDMLREFALSTKEGLALMVLAEALLRVPDARTADQFIEDKLGEGARTSADAERYFNSYASAIDAIGRTADNRPLPDRPGISVKLSALHPRFDPLSHERVMTELVPRLIDLARRAKVFDLNFTVDAEEADRLELSLEVIAAAFRDASLEGWDGFGLAIQAYQKRANDVIGYTDELARALNRRMMVRLVKGAYWDTEIKRAQERGLDDYPVFTRKAVTDLNYVACAQRLLALRPKIFPQFGAHKRPTGATVLELADGKSGFEVRRLHGMGEALYAQLREDRPGLAYRTYAPVGSHRDLLAYLVRRLLENGANSSFVAIAADDAVPVATLLRRPADIIGRPENARHPNIRLPRDLFQPQRQNSRGIEFGERTALDEMLSAGGAGPAAGSGAFLVGGRE